MPSTKVKIPLNKNMAENVAPSMVTSVTVKLLTFWTHRAQIWFHQAEAQFNLRNLTVDDTKY